MKNIHRTLGIQVACDMKNIFLFLFLQDEPVDESMDESATFYHLI